MKMTWVTAVANHAARLQLIQQNKIDTNILFMTVT